MLRQLRPPHRILTILEGESLLNDASALLIYRLAVGAVAAGGFAVGAVAPTFLFAVAGSLVVGPVLGWLSLQRDRPRGGRADGDHPAVRHHLRRLDPGRSHRPVGRAHDGVLRDAVARTAPERTPARLRIPSYAVWETVVFLLNVLAFVFIGLQIRPILDSLEPAVRGRYFVVAAAVLITVIVVRLAWHMSFNAVIRWRDRRFGFNPPRPMLRPTVGSGLIISWAGMRGIVTLAAALALPRRLSVSRPDRADRLRGRARHARTSRGSRSGRSCACSTCRTTTRSVTKCGAARERALQAALARVVMAIGRRRLKRCGRSSSRISASADGESESRAATLGAHAICTARALDAARQAVLAMRSSDEIGDDAFHRMEEELDWIEMSGGGRDSPRISPRSCPVDIRSGNCAHSCAYATGAQMSSEARSGDHPRHPRPDGAQNARHHGPAPWLRHRHGGSSRSAKTRCRSTRAPSTRRSSA